MSQDCQTASAPKRLSPSKIGKYDVVGVVGRGMGIVYKAIDPRRDREVAIKMMTGGFVDDPEGVETGVDRQHSSETRQRRPARQTGAAGWAWL